MPGCGRSAGIPRNSAWERGTPQNRNGNLLDAPKSGFYGPLKRNDVNSRPSSFARKGFSSLRQSRSESFSAIRLGFLIGWNGLADRGRLFTGFFESVLFSVIQMTDTDFFVRMF